MLDCIAVFALTCGDARQVFELTAAPDADDDRSRDIRQRPARARSNSGGGGANSHNAFTFGVPKKHQLKFFGNSEYERLYFAAIDRLQQMGGVRIEFDYEVTNTRTHIPFHNL